MDADGAEGNAVELQADSAESGGDVLLPQRPELLSTGFNPALGRVPALETISTTLGLTLDFVPSWTARRIPLKCIGLTLPEGVEFLPPPPVKPEGAAETKKAAAKRPATKKVAAAKAEW